MSKSSPARRRYQAENYARRNAARLTAGVIHAAAVTAAIRDAHIESLAVLLDDDTRQPAKENDR